LGAVAAINDSRKTEIHFPESRQKHNSQGGNPPSTINGIDRIAGKNMIDY
jgi:hypothetical protein